MLIPSWYALRLLKYLYHTRSYKLNYNASGDEEIDLFVVSN